MQFRVPIAAAVFLGSYFPLSLILLAQDYDMDAANRPFCWAVWRTSCSLPLKDPTLAIGIFAACAACFVVTLGSLVAVAPKQEVRLIEARYKPADLMNYTLPYIVSLMGIDYQEPRKFVGLLIFLGWMFWITYKSGQIVYNPLLIVLGWRLYEVSYVFAGGTEVRSGTALSKGRVEAGRRYRQQPVHDTLIMKNTDLGD